MSGLFLDLQAFLWIPMDQWSKVKTCVSCFWRCPGTSAPSATNLTVSLFLCSSESNVRGKSRALEGHRVSWKSSSRVWDGDKGVAGRNRREKYLPYEGSLIYPPGKSTIFSKKGNKTITSIQAQSFTRRDLFTEARKIRTAQALHRQNKNKPRCSVTNVVNNLSLSRRLLDTCENNWVSGQTLSRVKFQVDSVRVKSCVKFKWKVLVLKLVSKFLVSFNVEPCVEYYEFASNHVSIFKRKDFEPNLVSNFPFP